MIGIIVTGHANFASGLTSAVKLLVGTPENYEYVDYLMEDTTDDLELKFKQALEKLSGCKEGILVFADMMGGAPFKTAAEQSVRQKDRYKIQVVAGTNIGMLIQTNIARGYITDLGNLADLALEQGKKQIFKYENS